MQLSLNELTLDNVGIWPQPVKVCLGIAISVALMAASYYLYFQQQFVVYDNVQAEEITLRQSFEYKQKQAANLPSYRHQIAQMEEIFAKLLYQLPRRTEVPGLLEDISKTGVANGLAFQLFDPLDEVHHAFYTELPIRIEVTGDYHELAKFLSDLASLDRIVTVHSVTVAPIDAASNGRKSVARHDNNYLRMSMVAKTYRYNNEKKNGQS